MRLVAAIEDTTVARKILDHKGLASRAPPRGPPWRPKHELAITAGSKGDAIDPPAFAN